MSPVTGLEFCLPSPLQPFQIVPSDNHPVSFMVKRDDLIHPVISGNKWRKLQGFFEHWQQTQKKAIVSFGGGFSNHLHALGYACHRMKIPFVAMVRGNYSNNLTPMLRDLVKWQCDIRWLNKLEYKQKHDQMWLAGQLANFDDYAVIPEGGSSTEVHNGMAQLVSELPKDLDMLICPVASGGTMAGLIQAFWQQGYSTRVCGIAVLKGQDYLEGLVNDLITIPAAKAHPWQILHDYHGGGYAKSSPELEHFCTSFNKTYEFAIEPVYSGKVFYAVSQLLAKKTFAPGSKIAILHTGGLQGARK